MSHSIFAEKALLPDGWSNDVLVNVSSEGLIEAVETDATPPNNIERIDGILIPGMPNLHSHAFQRAFSGFAESRGSGNDSFWTWRKIMYQFVDKINPRQALVIAKQLYIEMLKSGYTSVAEFHYLHHESNGNRYDDPAEMSHSVINAAFETGIAITHLPVYYRYSGFNEQQANDGQRRFIHQPEEYHRLLDALYAHYRSDQRIRIGVAPHSLRAAAGADINAVTNVN